MRFRPFIFVLSKRIMTHTWTLLQKKDRFWNTAVTYLLFSIAPLAVVPPLRYPLVPPLSPYLALGSCFRIWVLIFYQFYWRSLFLRSFTPTNVSLPSIFRKLVGMTLLFTLTLTVLLQRNTRFFFFLLLLFSLLLCH